MDPVLGGALCMGSLILLWYLAVIGAQQVLDDIRAFIWPR